MTLIASRLVISESLLFCVELYRDIRHICTSFVSYTILRSDLQFALCRSLDQFLHYEVVMVLLTAFERFKLTALSRQLNHYSAPFLTRQALFYLFFERFSARLVLARLLAAKLATSVSIIESALLPVNP